MSAYCSRVLSVSDFSLSHSKKRTENKILEKKKLKHLKRGTRVEARKKAEEQITGKPIFMSSRIM